MNDAEEEQQDHIRQYVDQGCRKAGESLLSPYQQPLYNYLLGLLRNRADAEDCLQETFLRALKGLPRYEHRGTFRAWLFQIAHNVAHSRFRADQRQPIRASEEELERQPADIPHPAQTLETREKIEALENAITKLSADQRTIVLLRLRSDLSFREIAEVLDMPVNTALSHMHQAKAHLRHILNP